MRRWTFPAAEREAFVRANAGDDTELVRPSARPAVGPRSRRRFPRDRRTNGRRRARLAIAPPLAPGARIGTLTHRARNRPRRHGHRLSGARRAIESARRASRRCRRSWRGATRRAASGCAVKRRRRPRCRTNPSPRSTRSKSLDDDFFIVSELVEGRTLRERLEQRTAAGARGD